MVEGWPSVMQSFIHWLTPGGGADCLLTQTKTKNHHTSDPAPNFWNKMILGHFLDILVNFHWIPDWLPEGTGY